MQAHLRILLAASAIFLLAGCRPAKAPPAVKPLPTTFLLPVVLHQGNDPIVCGCRAPGGAFAFGTFARRILITEGEEFEVKDAGVKDVSMPLAMAMLNNRLVVTNSRGRIVYDMVDWSRLGEKARKRLEGQLITIFDERRVFTDTTELLIERIDIETGTSDFEFDQSNSADGSADSPQNFCSMEVSPDRKLLAIGLQTGTTIIDIETGKEKLYLRQPPWGPKYVAFSPNAQTLYVAGSGVSAWDLNTGAVILENANLPVDICAIAVSSDGSMIALGEADATNFPCHVCVLDNKLQLIHRFEAGLTKVSYLAFRENSHDLITATHGGDIKLWDLSN